MTVLRKFYMDNTPILGFFGEYRFLSNFYTPCTVVYEGLTFHSSENAYQAAKFDRKERFEFINITPAKSKRRAKALMINHQSIYTKEEWEAVRDGVMTEIVHSKFLHNPNIARLLVATGDRYLEETNTWGDDHFGVCTEKGLNRLGEILMAERTWLTTHGVSRYGP